MSKSALKWIIIFLFSILLLYSAYWLIVSSQFKSQVSSMLGERNNISYQSMFVSGFPYRMNMQIENLEIRNEFTEMKTDQLFIDLNPFDLEKIMLRIPKINGDVIIENEVLNFTATNLAARIDFKERNFDSLRLISDKIDTNYLQTNIAEFNKIKSQLGDIALQEHALCLKTEAIRKSFQDLEKGLMEKYGENAVINLETGEVKQKEDNG